MYVVIVVAEKIATNSFSLFPFTVGSLTREIEGSGSLLEGEPRAGGGGGARSSSHSSVNDLRSNSLTVDLDHFR